MFPCSSTRDKNKGQHIGTAVIVEKHKHTYVNQVSLIYH